MQVSDTYLVVFLSIVACDFCQELDPVCCNVRPNCKNVSTLSLTIQQYANLSPFYFPILSTDSEIDRYASGCTTFFPISNTTYLHFETIVYKDNTLNIKTFITSDMPGQSGIFRVQGLYRESGNSTTVYNAFIVDAVCRNCEPVYLFYKCYLYDDCGLVYSNEDVVVGMSSAANPPPTCLDKFESLVELTGLNVPVYVRLDGPRRCVVYHNKNTCVNADRVGVEAVVTLPLA